MDGCTGGKPSAADRPAGSLHSTAAAQPLECCPGQYLVVTLNPEGPQGIAVEFDWPAPQLESPRRKSSRLCTTTVSGPRTSSARPARSTQQTRPATIWPTSSRIPKFSGAADFTHNGGDTVYTWSPTGGESFVNGALAIDPGGNRIFSTIWDGNGTDSYKGLRSLSEVTTRAEAGDQRCSLLAMERALATRVGVGSGRAMPVSLSSEERARCHHSSRRGGMRTARKSPATAPASASGPNGRTL
jgi:hypothetical protein